MRILITGATGFVGKHLSQYFLEHTDWELIGTAYPDPPPPPHDPHRETLIGLDLREQDATHSMLDTYHPDYIIHLAAQSHVPTSYKDPWGTLENNIQGQLHLLQGCVTLKLQPRILVIGSSEEYGLVPPQDLPVDEDTPLRPLSPYALSKVAQDLMGLQYHLTHKLDVIRVRPFNHIGPRQGIGFVAPDFASQIAAIELGQQSPVMVVGNLAARRDFSDVRDVVRAYLALATQGQPGQVYNIGAGRSHSIQEMLDILLAMSKVPIEVKPDPNRMRPSDQPDIVCDATRLREATGWRTTIPFQQSMEDILEYWRQEMAGTTRQTPQ